LELLREGTTRLLEFVRAHQLHAAAS
jgi:hypothetical protein